MLSERPWVLVRRTLGKTSRSKGKVKSSVIHFPEMLKLQKGLTNLTLIKTVCLAQTRSLSASDRTWGLVKRKPGMRSRSPAKVTCQGHGYGF